MIILYFYKKTKNMKNKHYIFLILIFLILYLLYLIINYKYKEFQINSHIELIEEWNIRVSQKIEDQKKYLEYINTNAYRNKILKEEQSMKNKWENIIFITNESKYNTFIQEAPIIPTTIKKEVKIQDTMKIPEKWIYFLFQIDIRK